ncbi:MAG: hypothetical protein HZB37_09960, partial [Planctomycetes bacterium]|nr:hypothetical protein [Planctomycetota bacterium]
MRIEKGCFLWLVLVGFVLCIATTGHSEDASHQSAQDELLDIFEKLENDCRENQIRHTDILVEESIIMKDMNIPAWASKAKEAGHKIKLLYRTNYAEYNYWLVYAKYCALVNNERDVYGALKRMFYFKPNYMENYIAKGSLYTYLAKNTGALETISSTVIGYTDETVTKDNSVRYSRGREAKEAFVVALNDSTLSDARKACVHYKMGDLEINVLSDKGEAVKNWKKTVALSPE